MALRQVEKVINDYFQIPVTQSAITQKALKAAEQGKIGELARRSRRIWLKRISFTRTMPIGKSGEPTIF